ncbi:MAG TPA: right-handed parallel beta-helix repeat-containing protein, partial [Kofleriaceae bacterium]|nr:right-handed parallel beta-helix repeat-containing protein [Kofleriaceae bacterium]
MRRLMLACLLGCGGGGASGGDGGAADAAAGGDDAGPGETGWDPADFDNVYEVGPGQDYADPCEVPWESLAESSLVRIHWRAEPYACKWVINTQGTPADPIVVTGVPDAGRLPMITGDGAITRLELDYWNEDRSVIKIGGANLPDDMQVPAYVYVEALDIGYATPDYAFTDETGAPGTYADNAAAIHIEIGRSITVRGCALHDAGNGLFAGSQSSDVLISGNHVFDNGNVGSIYEHNSYTESLGITFEYNHYGPLRTGCDGNNLKDRSAGTVIRYNWIESGNRELDLVESDDAGFVVDPSYDTTFV